MAKKRDLRAESKSLPWDNTGNEAGAWVGLLRSVLMYRKAGASGKWIVAVVKWMVEHTEEAGRMR